MKKPGPKPVKLRQKDIPAAAAGPGVIPASVLPKDRLEWVEAWGMSSRSMSYVYRPTTVDGLRQVFETARQRGLTVGMKGGGRSYGDAFQNGEELVLDLSRMNRILDWNPATGIISVEPGVQIADLGR